MVTLATHYFPCHADVTAVDLGMQMERFQWREYVELILTTVIVLLTMPHNIIYHRRCTYIIYTASVINVNNQPVIE